MGGIFLTLATHGTDHYLVQRLLVARSQRDAARRLVLSGFLVLAQFVLFLALGSLLFVHYAGRPFSRGDVILPTFAATELPGAATGFILAAIVAAALSPSLNSMASATVRDFYLPYFRPGGRRSAADAGGPRLHRGLGPRADRGGPASPRTSIRPSRRASPP